ncbi:peptide chain release factor N(5)-glutamine methyltransferase [Aquimarina brevivitae]|uniref:Release factor glutamine methyltransferase n=1 Tax=Aquimarina brevivitae TaxID=323412 RepID=A0A4Q7P019_9FLAO|nr:peptide chain release factor N(5)-glutamine methyltransferase [Aquimarina brevivitae]RZS92618.1 release factor glutamine methyltransferase [Aquimarina brevivitae]
MKLKELRSQFIDSLQPIYGKEETLAFFYWLSDFYLGLSRANVAIRLEDTIEAEAISSFKKATEALLDFVPIQYIIGHTNFYGYSLAVNESVLIPRPETEELVEWIVNDSENDKKIKILDIGTGSGCIAIALQLQLILSEVYAIDISKESLALAEQNAKANRANITFLNEDILALDTLQDQFDIIVSNPPYVRNLEKSEIKANVLNYEPHQALFVDDDTPLIFYEKITNLAKSSLKPSGALYFEINQYLGEVTRQMILEKGFSNVVLRKDMFGNHRFIKATF